MGCGLGAVGLAAAKAGAATVLLTDLDQNVLRLAGDAAEANGVGEIVSTASLNWCEPEAVVLDNGPYESVLGADLLYDAKLVDSVAELLAKLLIGDDDEEGMVPVDEDGAEREHFWKGRRP